ncbi:hypothetical protein BJV78DRAFT_1232966 [Lactifluus subvellereus]|nr:hypothetical protein BJV78DRAFT_1232966 [Lactifluus subvellereus]
MEGGFLVCRSVHPPSPETRAGLILGNFSLPTPSLGQYLALLVSGYLVDWTHNTLMMPGGLGPQVLLLTSGSANSHNDLMYNDCARSDVFVF